MPDLAEFQRNFASALMMDGQPEPSLRSQAFAVYRNTCARGAVEALRAAYPTIDMLLGADAFTEVALDYRRASPPASPILSDYGADFADYIQRQPWTGELPYLADVARLDGLWLQSFLAPAADTLPRTLRSRSRIMLHPAARLAWLATPAMSIWLAHRDPDGFDELDPEWREEGALFTRPGLGVRAEQIDQASYRLLSSCAAPVLATDCLSAVANDFPDADLPKLLRRFIESGALIQ